ncbi:MAG: DNA-binding protein [Verrucomicrobiota bacterium]
MEPTENAPRPLVVCDAGPLIHLDEVGCLDLLADFSAVLVPDAVWNEVQVHRPTALTHPHVAWMRVRPLTPPPPELLALSQVFSLHRGEWEAIRVSLDHPGALFLTDDTAARMTAASLEISAHGSIGILVRAIRRNQRSKEQVLAILIGLPTNSSLHLKRSLLEAVILEVKQSL